MKLFRRLRGNEEGVGALEFALIAPLLITFIIGIAQLGILFMANAGLRSAVAEGARYASIYPRPTNAQIIARINDRRVGLSTANITGPTVTAAADNSYITISMSYAVPLNFIFFQTRPVTLTETRRVYTYAATTGGTTSTSASSTSASSTSASSSTSTGGTTTTTSSGTTTTSSGTTTTTTGGTTTTTTGGTTTTTGGSNGNGNSNGNGHGHGNSNGNSGH